jgi:hypothetical protein
MARRHSSLTKERRTIPNGLASHARTRTTSVPGLAFAPLLHPGPVLVFASGGRPIPGASHASGSGCTLYYIMQA